MAVLLAICRQIVASVLLMLSLMAPALGQESQMLQQGEPAPSDGVFLPLPVLQRLVETLRDQQTLVGQLAALEAQVLELEASNTIGGREIAALRSALDSTKLALAKAEWLDQNWQRIVDRYEATVQQQDKRIERLERQQTILAIAGPIGFLLGLFLLR